MERLTVTPNPKPAPAPKAPRVNRRATLADANAKLAHHRISYNAEWREYRVRPAALMSKAEQERRTYHTEDLQDAILTARHMDSVTDAQAARVASTLARARRPHAPRHIGDTRTWPFLFARLGVGILSAIRITKKMLHTCNLRTAVARIAKIHRAAIRQEAR